MAKKLVIFVGTGGSGRTSLIGLLTEDEKLKGSDSGMCDTNKLQIYSGKEYDFVDTVGYGYPKNDDEYKVSEKELTNLLTERKEEINCILYTKDKGVINKLERQSLEKYIALAKEHKIPFGIVITKCSSQNLQEWWDDNFSVFTEKFGLVAEQGCCVNTKNKREESQKACFELINNM